MAARRSRSPKKRAAPRSGGRKKKGRGKKKGGGFMARLGRFTLKWTAAIGLGATAGAAALTWALYEQARVDIDARLAGPVWQASGRVMSAPMEVWPGLRLSPGDLADDLVAAGYARVERASGPGDLQVAAQDLLVNVPAASGPGWAVPAGEVHVSFSGGRVSAVSPRARAVFAPVQLHELRGADNESRRPVTLDGLPDHVPQAVLAMEDARFYDHEGLDPIGILRAVVMNNLTDRPLQGGSTLTQQLVKNLFLTQERTYARKGREALLAVALERTRSKDQILELYLNEIYLGQAAGASVCGVDQAARVWFGKPAARLTVGEAATLAGVVSAPNRYAPLRHPEEARQRRDLVLDRMVEVGSLTAEAAAAEKARPLEVHPSAGQRRAPWAVDAALETIEDALGDGGAARGVVVHTTLQPALQRIAEQVVAEGAAELDAAHPDARGAQIAMAVVRVRDGAVVALVGGRDYAKSQFNRAVYGKRQAGSTIKPFTYLAAFEDEPGFAATTLIPDEPIDRRVDGKVWSPKNYDGRYLGEVTARQALATSRNVPAVLVAEQVGMRRLRNLWQSLGLSGATDNPAAALGSFEATPVELAGAYTVFAGSGRWSRPSLVRAAEDPDGGSLWNEEPVVARRAGAAPTFLATDLLQAVMTEGTGRKAAKYGATGAVGGKSGTTDGARDAWFVGVTPELAIAVWVGFDKGRPVGLTGSQAALPTFARFVAASGTTRGTFAAPAGVVQAAVCTESLQVAEASCPETTTSWFLEGAAPDGGCPIHGGVLDNTGDVLSSAWDRVKEQVGGNKERRPRKRLFGRRR